jgi:guanylate kinase
MPNHHPIIFLFSAPSGTGKGTLVAELLRTAGSLRRIITVTTRPKRKGEEEGSSYYFVTRDKFREWMDKGDEFIEWNGMYGDFYGTRKKYVERVITEAQELGDDLVLEIDVDGKEEFIRHYDHVVTVFILPPSLEELKRRIWTRKAESEEQMQKRFDRARKELARKDSYQHKVVNDDKDRAVEELISIIEKEREARRTS